MEEKKRGPPPLVPDTSEDSANTFTESVNTFTESVNTFTDIRKKLKIYLRDEDKTVVEAWNAVFHDARVTDLAEAHGIKLEFDIAEGNILDLSTDTDKIDVLVSSCHSTGSMTHGINNKYLQKFGARIETDLRNQIVKKHHGVLPVGRAIIIPLTRYTDKFRFLIGSPIMILFGHNETLGPFLAFKSILEMVETYNSSVKQENKKITTIACPALGVSEGVPAFRCALQMRAAIDSFFGHAFVGRDYKAQREFYMLLTTIKKPFAITSLYTP